jgi:DNA-binding NtrC family response regulator
MAKVMVVDDDQSMLRTLVRILKRAGYEPIPFTSAAEAAAHTSRVDIALLDIQLADSTGPELALRLIARWPDLPLVFVTGGATPTQLESAEAMGPVLPKPLDPANLLETIDEALCCPAAIDAIFEFGPDNEITPTPTG